MPVEPSDLTDDLGYVYSTVERVRRLMGDFGALEWTDHDNDGSSQEKTFEDAIYEATSEINQYLYGLYDPAVLVTSTWIVSSATKMAVRRICLNRLNEPPTALEKEYDRIIDMLTQIRDGSTTLQGVDPRADMLRPVLVNRAIDRRYARRIIRVDTQTSTDSPTVLRQDKVNDGPWWSR